MREAYEKDRNLKENKPVHHDTSDTNTVENTEINNRNQNVTNKTELQPVVSNQQW